MGIFIFFIIPNGQRLVLTINGCDCDGYAISKKAVCLVGDWSVTNPMSIPSFDCSIKSFQVMQSEVERLAPVTTRQAECQNRLIC